MNFYHKLIGILALSPALLQADSCSKVPFAVQCPSVSCDVNTIFISQSNIGTAGFVISSPGVYCIIEDLTSPGGIPVITVNNVNNVVIDGGGYTIDLNGGAGTGILIIGDAAQAIAISNLTIQNSGKPGSVEPSKPGIIVDFASVVSIQDFFNKYLAVQQAEGLQNPLASNNPFDAVGIGLQGNVKDITIENCQFLSMFVGIAAAAPVFNVIVNNCQAYDGGFDYTSQFPPGDNCPMRGGFAIFYNPSTDPNNANKSNNIQLLNCTAESQNWLYAMSFFSAKNSIMKNCYSSANHNNSVGTNNNMCHGLTFCDDCVMEDSTSFGGNDGFNLNFSTNCVVKNCVAFRYSDRELILIFLTFAL